MPDTPDSRTMDKALAIRITGGLSKPTKLPCHSYNLPAEECHVGKRLRNLPGSVCHDCYAFRGWYPKRPVVRKKLYRHFRAIAHPRWIEGMAFLIGHTRNRYFRWHDVGDLQSVEHLENIAAVALLTPNVLHWLPTREYKIVQSWLANAKRPTNLVIRLSAHLVDGPAPVQIARHLKLTLSSVHKNRQPKAYICPARDNGHQCGSCRACWRTDVPFVSYPLH